MDCFDDDCDLASSNGGGYNCFGNSVDGVTGSLRFIGSFATVASAGSGNVCFFVNTGLLNPAFFEFPVLFEAELLSSAYASGLVSGIFSNSSSSIDSLPLRCRE
jgi:hypothetical protein